jgi:hypothetical protein
VTAIAMVEIDAGREVTAVAAYRKALPKLWTLLGSVLVAAVLIALVDLTAVGTVLGAWLMVRWSLLAQSQRSRAQPPVQRHAPARASCAGTGGASRPCCSS